MNQNYYNNMDVPKVVDNIMTNLDTYSNNNSNNYVPINNLTYNPNTFEPYGQSKVSLQGGIDMQPQNMSMNNMNMPPSNMGTYNMGMDNRMNEKMMNQQMMNQQMMNQQMMNHQMMGQPNYNKKSKKVIKNIENLVNIENTSLFSLKSLKSLIIYVVLFIIFSHSKMTDIVCKFIPNSVTMVSNIPCISLKGLIMGILILLLHKFKIAM